MLKHFPGHGHGSGDSHTGGVSTPPIEQLQSDDLIPYRTLTTQHPVAVMLGHVQVPGLTGTDQASLSAPAYDLLRSGGYGGPPFTGLVYTDDLSSMAAINQQYGVPEAVLRSLQAGADIALWITTDEVPAVLDSLEQAVNSGQLSMERVNESATRVAARRARRPTAGAERATCDRLPCRDAAPRDHAGQAGASSGPGGRRDEEDDIWGRRPGRSHLLVWGVDDQQK